MRGRFTKGVSGNPAGRPKGAKDKRDIYREMIRSRAPEIVQALVDAGLAGDVAALKTLVPYLVLPEKPRDQVVALHMPAGPLSVKGEAVLDALGAGSLTPAEASSVLSALASQARLIEQTDILSRIEKLEEQR
jgi:hypothetical protein